MSDVDPDKLAKLLESATPLITTIFGAAGVGLGGLLKFLTDRESRKIKTSRIRLAKFDQIVEDAEKRIKQLEDELRHSQDAHRAIIQECRIANSFRNTFGIENISAAQVELLIKALNRARIYSADVLKDGKFSAYLDDDDN